MHIFYKDVSTVVSNTWATSQNARPRVIQLNYIILWNVQRPYTQPEYVTLEEDT